MRRRNSDLPLATRHQQSSMATSLTCLLPRALTIVVSSCFSISPVFFNFSLYLGFLVALHKIHHQFWCSRFLHLKNSIIVKYTNTSNIHHRIHIGSPEKCRVSSKIVGRRKNVGERTTYPEMKSERGWTEGGCRKVESLGWWSPA